MLPEHHILDLIRSHLDEMFPAERKVAEYILAHPEDASRLNITELAELSGSSDATVIRMCKRLGFTGFYQMKLSLSTELGYIQLLGNEPDQEEVMDLSQLTKLFARNMIGLEQTVDAGMLSECVDIIRGSDRVYFLAAGNSIPPAMDFSFRLSRIGIRTLCSPVIETVLNEISLGTSRETLVVLSHSGSSKQVIQGMELAKTRGMRIILLTHSSRSAAARTADYCLLTFPSVPLFSNYGIASHLFDQAVIDILLYLIAHRQQRRDVPDQMQFLLSEYKL